MEGIFLRALCAWSGAGVEPNGHWGVPADVEVDDLTWNPVDPAAHEVDWPSLSDPQSLQLQEACPKASSKLAIPSSNKLLQAACRSAA
eukprot:1552705-Amphidinium_carterae.2